MNLDAILGHLGGGEGMERAFHQAAADALVEARGDNGVARRRIRRDSPRRRSTASQLVHVEGSERRPSPTLATGVPPGQYVRWIPKPGGESGRRASSAPVR